VTEIERLYRAYFSDIYRYILKMSGSEHIAEDITEDTFFKAMRSIDSFRGECDVRVWLCQIAKNCYLSYIKRNSRLLLVDDCEFPEVADPSEGPLEQIEKREQALRIEKILGAMPEPYREVFGWRVYGEKSFKEIGSMFGKNENWACVTYHRARKMIKDRLEEI
jgi:RNA polymerase sigma-70 factor (ECF subfamily)